MSNKLCPYCGEEPIVNEYQSIECPNSLCPIFSLTFTVEEWNRRYVGPDKNGKKVYAGDEVRVLYGESRDLEGRVVWNKKHLRWTVVCGGKIVSFWQDQIELIESEAPNGQ